MNLTSLPDEILEEIFSYVQPGLWNLTEVCRKYNHVISHSTKLMNKMPIYWIEHSDQDVQALLNSDRCYREVRIARATVTPSMLKLLDQQSFITTLDVSDFKLHASELFAILNCVKVSLKSVSLAYLHLTEHAEVRPVEMLNLKKIKLFRVKRQVIGFFKASPNVENFECSDIGASYGDTDVKEFADTILSFEQLKSLYFVLRPSSVAILSIPYFTSKATFILDSFSLFGNSETSIGHFKELITKQTCLKELILHGFTIDDELLETILGMKTLHFLNLDVVDFRLQRNIRVENFSVEKLVIKYKFEFIEPSVDNGIIEILKNCRSVHELILKFIPSNKEISRAVAVLPKLDQLVLFLSEEMFPMNFPTVKSLTVWWRDRPLGFNILDIIKLNPQLTHIRLYDL